MKRVILLLGITLLFSNANAQTDGYAESEGVKIHYRVFGSGVPILIINGGPGLDCQGFEEVARTLAAHYEAIIYDQRGTGNSTMASLNAANITMKLMVADIENLRKKLKINQWIILGHSFGGMLASYYATMHPETVKAMILSSSGGIDLDLLSDVQSRINSRLTKEQSDSVNYWADRISHGDTTNMARWQRAKALANAYVFDKKYAPLVAARLSHTNPRVNGLIWQDMEKIPFNCAPKLMQFRKPVLIIQGKMDVVDQRLAVKAHHVLKNSKLFFVDHSVHYGWLDNSEEYFGEIQKFLSEN